MVSRLKDTLLLVGDAHSDRTNMRSIFESSFNLLEAESLSQAALLLEQNNACVAAVLVDLQEINDEDVRHLNEAAFKGSDIEIPVISLINQTDNGEREELAFSRGASDVVIKPYTPEGISRRVQVLVDLYRHKWHLQKLVEDQNQTIRNTNQVVLDALSAIIEHRNTEAGNHILRIRRFTKILLEDVAKNCPEYGLTQNTIDIIAGASALHDIGKISIPDAILNKPDKLTEAEFEVIKTHTTVGSQLIQNLSGIGDLEYLRYAYNICLYHHERWDGGGYPSGLSGEEIPICAQVAGIADTFDALTSARVYKPALPYEQAINMIINGECGVFSPKLLECFKHVRTDFVSLAHHYADGHSPKDETIALPLPGPTWKTNSLDTAQLSLVKYQTLLHYTNDMVMELDLDAGLYHIVYNPNPDLDSITPDAPFFSVADIIQSINIHPEDACIVQEIQQLLNDDFFRLNLRRRTFHCRVYCSALDSYRPYEVTFMRVNTGNEDQRIVIAVWHVMDENALSCQPIPQDSLLSCPALSGLVSTALRCYTDEDLTIDVGAKDLYLLTGYSETDIEQVFHNKLMNLVLPEDRDAFAHDMQEHLIRGGRTESEFRIKRKNKDPLWVLSKSRVYIEEDGKEYFYHAIRDNTRSKTIEHELRTVIERNQIIVDQSGGIVFEWDLLSDRMYCSPQWEKHFGYTPVSKNYGKQMGIATHFHPDDLPLIRQTIDQIKSHLDSIAVDVRIADSNAKYLWMRITASAYLDKYGQIIRIIGIIQDIDALKRAELALKERAERDALTKLLNKVSTQQMITDYLAEKDKNSLAVMFILDLDNFKSVNDNYGHLYGDAVLTQIGGALKQLFRSHDIVGRIGGDEFMVLMRDIPQKELIPNRCELILKTLRPILGNAAPDWNVSCSIGAAITPDHGSGYTDLYRHADEALYLSKARGKNTYTIYDPKEIVNARQKDSGHVSTRIDSDEQPGMADSSFVRYVFRQLYETDDIVRTIDDILAYVGGQLNVSRVYIFENNDDNTTCSNTFEWCNEGISPEKDFLQNVSYITDIAGWQNVYDENGIFYCTDITKLDSHFRDILEPQNIKSMLQCSIRDNGMFRGYIGFDECSVHRLWTQEQISLLQFLAEVMAMFLLKKRTQDKVAAQAEELRSILDRQDIWLYVIDPDTCELKFLNKKTREVAPNSLGMPCYKALRNRDSRCEICPAAHIHRDKNGSAIIEGSALGKRLQANASEISWNGETACLIFCHALEEQ